MSKQILSVLAAVLLAFVCANAAETESTASIVDYANPASWAYYSDGNNKDADVFLICPTVDMNDEYNMSVDDEATKASFQRAHTMCMIINSFSAICSRTLLCASNGL